MGQNTATDPVSAAQTDRGRWIYGVLIGGLMVMVRLMADRNGQVLVVEDGKITSKSIDLSAATVLTLTFGMDIVEVDIAVEHMAALR